MHGGPVALVGIVGLVLIGAAFRKWEAVAVALPGFVLYGLICMMYTSSRPRLTVRRYVDPDVLNAGKTAIVTLEVSNRRAWSPGMVEVFDVLPNTVELVKGKNHRMFDLGPYETKRMKYKVRFHIQGDTKLGPTRWRAMDRMAYFFDERNEEVHTVVTVQRGVEDARKLRIPPMRTDRPFGQSPARVKGIGTEFYGLREYTPFDSLRTVNWKASARLGKLISKEFEDERLGDVVLVVDMRPSMRVGEGSLNTVDACMNGAMAVAQKILDERNRLAIVYLRKGIGWISGITSRRHIQEIIERADFPEELEMFPIHWLPWIVQRSFKTRAFVVVFSTLLDDTMAAMLMETARMGYELLCVSPAPNSSVIGLYTRRPHDAALRITRDLVLLRRRNRILKLSKSMKVVDWDFGEPLAVTLKRLERHRGGARWRPRTRPIRA